jgi:hypothetical protein
MHFFICELQKKLGRVEYIRGGIGLYMAHPHHDNRQESANNRRNPRKRTTTDARPKLRYYTKQSRTHATTQRNHIEEGSNVQAHQWSTVNGKGCTHLALRNMVCSHSKPIKNFSKTGHPVKTKSFWF